MANFALKLKLIVWKNFIIRKRHKILTILEFLVTVFLFAILAYVQTILPQIAGNFINQTEYYEEDVLDLDLNSIVLLYAPNNNPEINKLMEHVRNNMVTTEFAGFGSETELLDRFAILNDNVTYYTRPMGIVFDSLPKNGLPKHLNYRIRTRFYSKEIASLFPSLPPYYQSMHKDYVNYGFSDIQKRIDMAFIEMTANPTTKVNITLQQMPTPPHDTDNPIILLHNIFIPMFTLLSFILIFPSVLKRVIEEKNSGIKELMKMMGLESWMLWLGWFIHSMVINIISITFITVILKVNFAENSEAIFPNANGGIIWLFMFLYCVSGVFYSFAASTIFNKPTLGMCVGMLVWNITFFVILPIAESPADSSQGLVNFLLIFPNTCLLFGLRSVTAFEKEGGLTFSNLFKKPNKYTPAPSMGQCLVMFIVDSIIFLILTWYIENVHPGNYGTPRPWYFPFTKSYWFSNKVQDHEIDENNDNRPEVEPVTNNLEPGIQIRNLRKKFKNNYAVDGLTLDIYNKQITVLLGHNGAGKTTTMNIITGMITPSNGTAVVDGHDIKTNMNKVRQSLGLCPQHNLQFPDLTVIEHLIFFAMLKGLSKSEATLESLDFLQRLNLKSKAYKMATELSGGMRRKLSLGIALVGKTKVLMLDEPTSGLDPEARREIWDFLLGMRGERTILITTHYMEEADILGDRIAIMHHGQLMCYGTSLFLKKHYGTGYTLSILTAQDWNINTITETIKSIVPSAVVKSISTGTVIFSLPTSDTKSLSQLFTTLEKNKLDLHIANFGVSITSLEDVFLRVGELADEVDKSLSKKSDTDSDKLLLDNPGTDCMKNENHSNIVQQFIALLVKRGRYSMHKKIFFILQAMVPVIMGLILFGIMKSNSNNDEKISVNFRLGNYLKSQSFYSTDSENIELSNWYKTAVSDQGSKATPSNDVYTDIIKIAENDEQQYFRTLVTAAKFNESKFTGLYGVYAMHGPPISLNLITNSYLKYLMKDDSYGISTTNNPLPDIDRRRAMSMGIVMMWVFQIPVAYTVMIGFFIAFPQGEKSTGIKHLQIMSGVKRIVYWLTTFVFDYIVYIFVTILVIVVVLLFDSGGIFGNCHAIMALVELLLLYGLSGLPFAYLLHYRPTAASSMNVLIWIQILVGNIGATVMYFLQLTLTNENDKNIVKGFSYIFLLIPNFAISDGIQHFANKAGQIHNWNSMPKSEKDHRIQYGHECADENSRECKEFLSFYYGTDHISNNLIYLAVNTLLYWCLLLFIDSGLPKFWFDELINNFFYKNDKNIVDNNIDEDVANERDETSSRINIMNSGSNRQDTGSYILLVHNLRKWFKRFYAVRGLNFSVKKGECFGLLGINGAGKTTTFKMLTGDIFPSTGSAILEDCSLMNNKYEYLRKTGYCPQFDALNMELTTREMLELFANLRGIPSNKVRKNVDKWISKFDIKKYENIPCGKLSGGNKRKLSTAIALIGDPPLIMLDEPTSGVDPVARRNLWDILDSIRKSGQSIVLTSHSMDECEALCDRLGIMVDGQMKCLGNIQHLKTKFGQGFTVMVKLRTVSHIVSDVDNVDSSINVLKRTIENKYICKLKDEHTGMVLYHVTNPNVTLGELFTFMENLKSNQEIIEDYAVSDTSLEQVFLSFAKEKDRIDSAGSTNIIV